LNYPTYRLVIGGRDAADPAYPILARVRERHPEVDIDLLVTGEGRHPSPKVNNLEGMAPSAKHDIVWLSDSNTPVHPDTLAAMKERGQVLLRYCDARGEVTDEANPNGSLENIAAVANETGNVMGLMPHPERASEAILGSDGTIRFVYGPQHQTRGTSATIGVQQATDVLELGFLTPVEVAASSITLTPN
jgi:hypothetical protein